MLITYILLANISISDQLVSDVRNSLCAILSRENEGIDITRTLYVLRFSIRHRTPQRRFIADEEVIGALMHALKRITEGRRENLFPLVMDTLCYLIDDGTYDERPSGHMLILYR